MSDSEHGEKKSLPIAKVVDEPAVGGGARSLANWEKLASARRDLSGNDKARASLQTDPQAFLASYGINASAFTSSGGQLGVTALERQLAFSGSVERDTLGVHRGCELVIGPVAATVAGALAAVVAGVEAAVVVALANVTVTANWTEGT